MASGRRVGQRPGCHTFLCKFWHFQMAVSCLRLGLFSPNLGILQSFVYTLWLCGSIVANPIIYRLVPSPSQFEIRQCLYVLIACSTNWWPHLAIGLDRVGYLRNLAANFGSLIWRLTVKIFRFWRLTVNFLAIWRLTVNPIENLLQETISFVSPHDHMTSMFSSALFRGTLRISGKQQPLLPLESVTSPKRADMMNDERAITAIQEFPWPGSNRCLKQLPSAPTPDTLERVFTSFVLSQVSHRRWI